MRTSIESTSALSGYDETMLLLFNDHFIDFIKGHSVLVGAAAGIRTIWVNLAIKKGLSPDDLSSVVMDILLLSQQNPNKAIQPAYVRQAIHNKSIDCHRRCRTKPGNTAVPFEDERHVNRNLEWESDLQVCRYILENKLIHYYTLILKNWYGFPMEVLVNAVNQMVGILNTHGKLGEIASYTELCTVVANGLLDTQDEVVRAKFIDFAQFFSTHLFTEESISFVFEYCKSRLSIENTTGHLQFKPITYKALESTHSRLKAELKFRLSASIPEKNYVLGRLTDDQLRELSHFALSELIGKYDCDLSKVALLLINSSERNS